eukprot:Gb_29229 [translate_table: standard]
MQTSPIDKFSPRENMTRSKMRVFSDDFWLAWLGKKQCPLEALLQQPPQKAYECEVPLVRRSDVAHFASTLPEGGRNVLKIQRVLHSHQMSKGVLIPLVALLIPKCLEIQSIHSSGSILQKCI